MNDGSGSSGSGMLMSDFDMNTSFDMQHQQQQQSQQHEHLPRPIPQLPSAQVSSAVFPASNSTSAYAAHTTNSSSGISPEFETRAIQAFLGTVNAFLPIAESGVVSYYMSVCMCV